MTTAVLQLNLPSETVDHICSFAFYTKQQIITKNKKKYNRVLRQLK